MPAQRHRTSVVEHNATRIDRHNLNTQRRHVTTRATWREQVLMRKMREYVWTWWIKAMWWIHWFEWNSLQRALVLISGVWTQNKLIPWHCSVFDTEHPSVGFTALYRATQRGNKPEKAEQQRNSRFFCFVFLICWSHSQVILAPESGDPKREQKQD